MDKEPLYELMDPLLTALSPRSRGAPDDGDGILVVDGAPQKLPESDGAAAVIDEDTVARAALVLESALEGCLVNDADIEVGECGRTRTELHQKYLLESIVTRVSIA